VEGSEGIRLVAENLAYDGSQLSLDVLAAYEFDPAFAAAFQRLSDALVLGVENAETGAAAAVPLIDPRKTFPARSGPNFQGIRPWPGNKIGLTGGSVIMPLEISVPWSLLDGPSLYLTMFLQRHISNTLAIDLGGNAVGTANDTRNRGWNRRSGDRHGGQHGADEPYQRQGPNRECWPGQPRAGAAYSIGPHRGAPSPRAQGLVILLGLFQVGGEVVCEPRFEVAVDG